MRSKSPSTSTPPPVATYPATPHTIGLDWVELRVRRPAGAALLYRAIGFSPRSALGRCPILALGGLVIVLRPRHPRQPKSSLVLQLAVDNVDLKHHQFLELGLHPSGLRRSPRGDRYFHWQDADGHTLRFVGPARRPDDPTID